MQKLKEELMEKEKNYILNKYFNNVKVAFPLTKMKTRPASKSDALVNDKPYTIYDYNYNGIMLVPKAHSIFKGDFDNIYEISEIENIGLHFSIINKTNGIIKYLYYDFLMNEFVSKSSCVNALINYSIMNDKENELYNDYKKQDVTSEIYLARSSIFHLNIPEESKTFDICKYEDGRVEKCNYPSFEEVLKLGFEKAFNFKPLNIDIDAPLFTVAEDIIDDKVFTRVRKK